MDWVSRYRDEFEIKCGRLHWKRSGSGKRRDLLAESMSKRGYYVVRLDNKIHYVHRVIFAMVHGWLPHMIDHVDRNKTNNQIANLRPACHSLNGWNKSGRGKSGYTGVTFCKDTGRWRAVITVNGMNRCCGRHKTPELALKAREEAAKIYCYDFP